MGLGDITSRILTSYKADTSEHKAAIRGLRGEEKARHQALLADVNAQNAKIDSQIAMMGKLAVGVGAAVAAWKMASAAAKSYLEDVRLESAAAGANLGGLQKATLGLVEADNLLAFAGKAMNGTWKLNQSEMERVLHGAMALRKTMGVELQPTIDSLTESIAKGNTRALKEFGIEAKDKEGVLKELDGLYKGLGGNASLAGDNIQASGVKLADSFDDIKGHLGKMVVELMPAIEAMAEFVAIIAKGIGELNGFTDALVGVDTSKSSAFNQRMRQAGELRGQAQIARFVGDEKTAANLEYQAKNLTTYAKAQREKKFEKDAIELGNSINASILAATQRGIAKANEEAKRKIKSGSVSGGSFSLSDSFELPGVDTGPVIALQQEAAKMWWLSMGLQVKDAAVKLGLAGSDTGAILKQGMANSSGVAQGGIITNPEHSKEFDKMLAKQQGQPSILEQIVGPISEVNAQVEAIGLATVALDSLKSAGVQLWAEWANGGEVSGKKLLKAVVLQIGQHLQARAIEEAVIGAAKTFTAPPLAAGHFAAAGIYQAGAIAMGATARAIGNTGGGGGGVAPSIVSGSGRSSSTANDNRPINVYVGAEWAGMSPTQQSTAIYRAIQAGKRGETHVRRG